MHELQVVHSACTEKCIYIKKKGILYIICLVYGELQLVHSACTEFEVTYQA